jgi:hypothetical protein
VATVAWGIYSCRLLEQGLWEPVGLKRLELLILWYAVWALAFLVGAPAWFAPVTLIIALAAYGAAFGPMAVATVLLFLFSCYVTGALLWRAEKEDAVSRLLRLLLGVAIWMTVIWTAVHFRVNYAATYLIAFCAPLAIRPRLTRACLADSARLFRPVKLDGRSDYAALVLMAFPLICHFLVAAKPETGPDAMGVHLVVPLWVQFRHYWPFDFVHYAWALMPLGADWAFTAVIVPGGEYAGHLLNFTFMSVLTGLVYATSRRFVPCAAALILAGVFATTPLMQLATGSLMSENLWAVMVFGAVLAIERFRSTGLPRWFCAAATLFGAALATKLGTVAFLAPAMGFAGWELIRRRRTLPRCALVAGSALCLLVLFGAPPYLFAWVRSGNPVFPFMNNVFKSPAFASAAPFVDLRWQMPLNAHMPYDTFFHSHWFLESHDGVMGFQNLLLVPLGLLALRRRQSYLVWLFLGVALVGALAEFGTIRYVRYLYPALAPMGAVGAVALAWLRADRVLFKATLATLVLALGLNVYFLPSSSSSHSDFFISPFNRKESARYLATSAQSRLVSAYLNRAHPEQAVAFLAAVGKAGLKAEAYDLGWHTWTYSHQVASMKSPEEYARLNDSLGIRYFVAPSKTSGTSVPFPVVAAFLERYTELEFSTRDFEVRRLKGAAVGN